MHRDPGFIWQRSTDRRCPQPTEIGELSLPDADSPTA
jgi:hypothetical protein